MGWIEITGLTGSFLSSITFIPQVIKVYRTQSAKDLSLLMLFIILTSTMVWLVYGFALDLLPVIICNAIIFLLSAWLIWFKMSEKK